MNFHKSNLFLAGWAMLLLSAFVTASSQQRSSFKVTRSAVLPSSSSSLFPPPSPPSLPVHFSLAKTGSFARNVAEMRPPPPPPTFRPRVPPPCRVQVFVTTEAGGSNIGIALVGPHHAVPLVSMNPYAPSLLLPPSCSFSLLFPPLTPSPSSSLL
eukprot:902365-Rhodomonas_salina.2